MTQRREWGVLVERAVADVLEVDHVDDQEAEAYDLRAHERVLVATNVDGTVGVLQEDDVGEVKAVQRRVCRESKPQAGRVHITRRNHLELLERGGWYAIVVYDPDVASVDLGFDDVDDAFEKLLVVPAETVDVLVDSWRDSTHGYEYTQLAWTSIADVVEETLPSRSTNARVATDGGNV